MTLCESFEPGSAFCSPDDRAGMAAAPPMLSWRLAPRVSAMRLQRSSHSFDRVSAHETKFTFAAAAASRAESVDTGASVNANSMINAKARIVNTFCFK